MRWFSTLAFIVSLISLTLSIFIWQQADARADDALRRREKILVEKHRLLVVRWCREFRIKNPPEDAQTLDELLTPLHGLLEGLSK